MKRILPKYDESGTQYFGKKIGPSMMMMGKSNGQERLTHRNINVTYPKKEVRHTYDINVHVGD
jgi:hypothetical protein